MVKANFPNRSDPILMLAELSELSESGRYSTSPQIGRKLPTHGVHCGKDLVKEDKNFLYS